jgi:hypothetical protein
MYKDTYIGNIKKYEIQCSYYFTFLKGSTKISFKWRKLQISLFTQGAL